MDEFPNKLLILDTQDNEMMRIATNVPLVSKPIAVITGIVNFILPGFGTLIAACCTESYAVSKT